MIHLIFFIIIVLLCAFICFEFLRRRPLPRKTHTKLAPILSFLSSPHTTLTSRATANKRLVNAFGINNSFTTADPCRHKQFLAHATQLLKGAAPVDPDMNLLVSGCELAPAVREMTLKTVLTTFFPNMCAVPERRHVKTIAEKINTLWLASKTGNCKIKDQAALSEALSAIFGAEAGTDPLNIIMPAFETLWRVVLSAFLEVQFRGPQEWREAMLAGGTEAENIVLETLRLYPPTKRINRTVGPDRVVEAADAEAIQRNPDVWGPNAAEFCPQRWLSKGKDGTSSRRGFLAFGGGKFVCPAKTMFAVDAVVVLVKGMFLTVREESVELWRGKKRLEATRGCGRGDMEGVVITWGEK